MSVKHSMGTIGEALIPSRTAFILVSHQYLSVKPDEINHGRLLSSSGPARKWADSREAIRRLAVVMAAKRGRAGK